MASPMDANNENVTSTTLTMPLAKARGVKKRRQGKYATTPEPPYGIQEVPFPEEVESVMNDVRFAVEEIALSKKYAVTPISAHLNIVTKEDRTLFVLMSPQGFRILGDARDTENIENGPVYETIQALLDRESPEYRRRFSEALTERLKAIVDEERS